MLQRRTGTCNHCWRPCALTADGCLVTVCARCVVLAQEQVEFDDELELEREPTPELSVDLLASLVDSYGASQVIERGPTGTSSSSTSKPKGHFPQPATTESIRNSRVLQDDVSTEPCPPYSAADGDGSRPTQQPEPDTQAAASDSARFAATVTPGPLADTHAVGDDASTEVEAATPPPLVAVNYLVSDVSSSELEEPHWQVDAEPSYGPSLSPLLLTELETPVPLLAVPRLDVTQHKTRRVRRPKHDLKILGHHDDASSDDACTPGIKPRSTLTASLKRRRVLDISNACVSTAVSP